MSYRALITCYGPSDTPVGDFVVHLGDDWSEGETFARIAAAHPNIDAVRLTAGAMNIGERFFETAISREEWIGIYADESYAVEFESHTFTKDAAG